MSAEDDPQVWQAAHLLLDVVLAVNKKEFAEADRAMLQYIKYPDEIRHQARKELLNIVKTLPPLEAK